jgi:hypothetical protein
MAVARIIFLSLLISLFSSPVWAIGPEHLWSHSFGDTSIDRGIRIAVDGDGNTFVTGSFGNTVNFGGDDLTSAGMADIFLAKFDADGVHQWSKSFGGTHIDIGIATAADAAGGVVITGYFSSTVNFGGDDLTTNIPSTDIYLAKFGPNGAHQWSQGFGSIPTDVGYDVAFDSGGNIVLTGTFSDTVSFGGADLISVGSWEGYLAKFDGSGGHIWSKRYGGTEQDWSFALGLDGADNIVVTGFFEGTANFGGSNLASAGSVDMFLAGFDAGGAHQWSHSFGDVDDDQGLRIAVDAAGNSFVTGWFEGTVDFGGGDLTTVNGNDIFLAKYDASGAHQWSQCFGGEGNDAGFGLALDGSGSIILTGHFHETANFGGGDLASVGNNDLFLAAFDGDGVHQWSTRYGDTGTSSGRSVAIDPSNNIVLTGELDGTVNLGGEDLVTAGESDILIAKFHLPEPVAGGYLDIKPGSCPNPLNVKNLDEDPRNPKSNRGGVLPVAVYGTEDFDVAELDVSTLQLEGVPALRHSMEDVGGPTERASECDCAATEADGHVDLTLKFKKSDVARALGDVYDGDVVPLTLTGQLLDGTPWASSDCVLIRGVRRDEGEEPGTGKGSESAVLAAARPNPFNPSTTISFSLTRGAQAHLAVYDVSGRLVRTLVSGFRAGGDHSVAWDGTDNSGKEVASGVYLYRLSTRDFKSTRKMVLLK